MIQQHTLGGAGCSVVHEHAGAWPGLRVLRQIITRGATSPSTRCPQRTLGLSWRATHQLGLGFGGLEQSCTSRLWVCHGGRYIIYLLLRQDKELNRRIGLAAMTFGTLKSMVFTSKKVSMRVKNNVYSARLYRFFCMELQNHGPYP